MASTATLELLLVWIIQLKRAVGRLNFKVCHFCFLLFFLRIELLDLWKAFAATSIWRLDFQTRQLLLRQLFLYKDLLFLHFRLLKNGVDKNGVPRYELRLDVNGSELYDFPKEIKVAIGLGLDEKLTFNRCGHQSTFPFDGFVEVLVCAIEVNVAQNFDEKWLLRHIHGIDLPCWKNICLRVKVPDLYQHLFDMNVLIIFITAIESIGQSLISVGARRS